MQLQQSGRYEEKGVGLGEFVLAETWSNTELSKYEAVTKLVGTSVFFVAVNDFTWCMHPSLQSKYSILIRSLRVDHVAIENTLMPDLKHVQRLCPNTGCLTHPIIQMWYQCAWERLKANSPHLFFNNFWGPLRKLEHSPTELVWAQGFTLTTNVVQMYPSPNTNLSSTGEGNKIMILWKVFENVCVSVFGYPSLVQGRIWLLFACQSLVWSTAWLNYSWGGWAMRRWPISLLHFCSLGSLLNQIHSHSKKGR